MNVVYNAIMRPLIGPVDRPVAQSPERHLYDLGHFKMYDGEMLPFLVFPYLVEGYREVTVLPPNYEQQVSLASLLIAVRTLARTLEKRPACIDDHHGLKSIQKDTQILLA